MKDFETADGPRRETAFPPSWGEPPSDMEQRAGWIKAKIRAGEIARDFGEEVPWLPSVARSVARLRLRMLERRRWSL